MRATAASTSSTAGQDGNIGWIDPGPSQAGLSAAARIKEGRPWALPTSSTSVRFSPHLKAQSKKQLLQELCAGRRRSSPPSTTASSSRTLLQREKLGSTGLGQGIAIPHGKIPSIDRVYGLFARLAHPIDFDAVDDQPVDLVFLLLAPEHAGADHLKALAQISRLLRDPAIVAKAAWHRCSRGNLRDPYGALGDGGQRGLNAHVSVNAHREHFVFHGAGDGAFAVS